MFIQEGGCFFMYNALLSGTFERGSCLDLTYEQAFPDNALKAIQIPALVEVIGCHS
jgi:hypothetical protein